MSRVSHQCLEYWLKGRGLLKGRNTLLFNRVCKNLEVFDDLRSVNTQSLFTLVHSPSFVSIVIIGLPWAVVACDI